MGTNMSNLTEEQKQEYINTSFTKCPFCKSDQTEGSSINIDSNSAWQKITCLHCDKQWNDIYTLTDIEEIK